MRRFKEKIALRNNKGGQKHLNKLDNQRKEVEIKEQIFGTNKKDKKEKKQPIEINGRGVRCTDGLCSICHKMFSYGWKYKNSSRGELCLCIPCKHRVRPKRVWLITQRMK